MVLVSSDEALADVLATALGQLLSLLVMLLLPIVVFSVEASSRRQVDTTGSNFVFVVVVDGFGVLR